MDASDIISNESKCWLSVKTRVHHINRWRGTWLKVSKKLPRRPLGDLLSITIGNHCAWTIVWWRSGCVDAGRFVWCWPVDHLHLVCHDGAICGAHRGQCVSCGPDTDRITLDIASTDGRCVYRGRVGLGPAYVIIRTTM